MSLAAILVFAALLALVQWLATGRVTLLPVKTVAVFVLLRAAVRMAPWVRWAGAAQPGSRLYAALLFALFVRHFLGIFTGEARRVLTARGLAVRRRWGRGWLRSLAWALAALFSRSLVRAERFYAAQRLRGLAE